MLRSQKSVTLRPVGNRKKGKNISQEPEMKKFIEVDRVMTEEEKTRTKQYLKGQDGSKAL
jgi:hypothetical protein